MAISYIYTGEPMNGTANDDFMVAIPFVGYTGTVNNTINGNDGDDVVLGDGMYFFDTYQSNPNGSIASAMSLENLNVWTTSENPLFANSSVPHATTIVETTIGQAEFFSVAVGAGQTMTVDIDFAHLSPTGNGTDLIVEIVDAGGNVLASNDDTNFANGGEGSFSGFDPYLTYTPASAGTYYIKVHPFNSATFTDNNTFMLNVSVTGHAVSADPGQGNDIINGGNGADSLFGQGGDDIIHGGADNDVIYGGSGHDTLYGETGVNLVHGDAGNDTIYSGGQGSYYGDDGNDLIYAGLGTPETLDGGIGVDTLDTTTFSGNYTVDLSTGLTNYTGEAFTNFENLITGAGNDTVTGTSTANVITTSGGLDNISAGAGNDTLRILSVAHLVAGEVYDGGADVDTLSVSNSSSYTFDLSTVSLMGLETLSMADPGFNQSATVIVNSSQLAAGNFATVNGVGFDDVTNTYEVHMDTNNLDLSSTVFNSFAQTQDKVAVTGSLGDDTIIGSNVRDVISGSDGNDILRGGAGIDELHGGVGNDTLQINALAELALGEVYDGGDGLDTLAVYNSGTYNYDLSTVSLNGIETLSMADPGAFLFATVIVNSSQLAAGNFSTVNGVVFPDVTDTYEIHMNTTSVNLSGTVFNNFAGSVDKVVIVGSSGDDTIVGSSVHDVITGGDGNDSINGGIGIDNMQGGLGNDLYYVDNASDTTIEANGAGTDKVFSSVTYSIATQFIEQLELTGVANINATGNVLNNILIGNAGNNSLNGSAGIDNMQGGLGDDIYFVDNTGDVVVEANAAGNDKIFSSVTYSVASQFVEQVWLTGVGNVNATGNILNNILIGNAGNNSLNGSAGIDNMQGGLGDDIYFVDNTGDVVVEANAAGTDKVFSTVTYSVATQFVEQLWLTGVGNINATGNSLNNVIIGNSGNNVITGGAGVDNMQGGLGNDSYFVDSSSDIVAEGGGAGTDTIYSTVSFVESVNVENLVLIGAANINATGNSLANLLKGNTGSNVLDGQASNDTLMGVSGADTAMYQLLTGADARGGNGSDTWTDFTLGDTTINANADKINIASLLIGYGGGGTLAALDPYLTVNISGSNTTVLIDRDGAGATYSDTLLLTLNGVNTNLLTLLNNHQFIA